MTFREDAGPSFRYPVRWIEDAQRSLYLLQHVEVREMSQVRYVLGGASGWCCVAGCISRTGYVQPHIGHRPSDRLKRGGDHAQALPGSAEEHELGRVIWSTRPVEGVWNRVVYVVDDRCRGQRSKRACFMKVVTQISGMHLRHPDELDTSGPMKDNLSLRLQLALKSQLTGLQRGFRGIPVMGPQDGGSILVEPPYPYHVPRLAENDDGVGSRDRTGTSCQRDPLKASRAFRCAPWPLCDRDAMRFTQFHRDSGDCRFHSRRSRFAPRLEMRLNMVRA